MPIDEESALRDNPLVFKEADKYQYVECGLLAAGLFIILAVGIIVVIYIICKKKGREEIEEKAHTMFQGFIKKSTYLTPNTIAEAQNDDAVVIIIEKTSDVYQQVRLFGEDSIIDLQQDCMPLQGCGCGCGCGICCMHFWTYFYFFMAAFLAGLWFIVLLCENSIYRKTTTCNDINVKDNSFTCFDLNDQSRPVQCPIGSSPNNKSIFCYLYEPNPGAAGIAYGFVKLILIGVVIYFKVLNQLRQYKCCQYILLILQVGGMIIAPLLLTFTLPFLQYKTKLELYFFHGRAVLRVAMFVLVVVTPTTLIPAPWCCLTNSNKFKDVVLEQREEKERQDPKENSPPNHTSSEPEGGASAEMEQPADVHN